MSWEIALRVGFGVGLFLLIALVSVYLVDPPLRVRRETSRESCLVLGVVPGNDWCCQKINCHCCDDFHDDQVTSGRCDLGHCTYPDCGKVEELNSTSGLCCAELRSCLACSSAQTCWTIPGECHYDCGTCQTVSLVVSIQNLNSSYQYQCEYNQSCLASYLEKFPIGTEVACWVRNHHYQTVQFSPPPNGPTWWAWALLICGCLMLTAYCVSSILEWNRPRSAEGVPLLH